MCLCIIVRGFVGSFIFLFTTISRAEFIPPYTLLIFYLGDCSVLSHVHLSLLLGCNEYLKYHLESRALIIFLIVSYVMSLLL